MIKCMLKYSGNLFLLFSFMFSSSAPAFAETLSIPTDTRVFVETLEEIIGKKGRVEEGQRIRAKVWKDVVVNRRVVIAKGASVLVRVDYFKTAKIAGRKGKITLGAYEVQTVDGQAAQLNGGYYKEGKGRIALTATLAGVVFLPFIFIKGKKASLPEGTVFDAYLSNEIDVQFGQDRPTQTISLQNFDAPALSAEILYGAMQGVEKPKMFPVSIQFANVEDPQFSIDKINGEDAKDIDIENIQRGPCDIACTYTGDIPIKKLVKQFKKGLNTIDVSTVNNGERISTEVLVDIEI